MDSDSDSHDSDPRPIKLQEENSEQSGLSNPFLDLINHAAR
jgi:hypothetical protein